MASQKFGGGTLRANASFSVANNVPMYVNPAGATIDTGTNTVTLNTGLYADGQRRHGDRGQQQWGGLRRGPDRKDQRRRREWGHGPRHPLRRADSPCATRRPRWFQFHPNRFCR